jgi:hypothetical protein
MRGGIVITAGHEQYTQRNDKFIHTANYLFLKNNRNKKTGHSRFLMYQGMI